MLFILLKAGNEHRPILYKGAEEEEHMELVHGEEEAGKQRRKQCMRTGPKEKEKG